jgi:hypothetical protein
MKIESLFTLGNLSNASCGRPSAKVIAMKTSYFSAAVFALALCLAGTPSRADSVLQNGTPGAQGTEGTNPTHQDQNVTGPNGQHSTNTNPANSPALASKSSCGKSCSSAQ